MPDFNDKRYEAMKYRHCGKSGLKLPLISLGFWQSLGEPEHEEICRDAMYYAFDNGITHFDLANNYGPPAGNSERIVGKYLKEMPRDELIISTKAGFGMWPGPYGDGGSKKYLIASLDQSLQRMGLEYVDIFYHHRFDEETPLEETMGALDQIVRQGKALYVGVSNYPGKEYCRAVQIIKENRWTPLTIFQPYYHMFHREIEFDVLPFTEEFGTGAIAFCPLSGGLISDKYLNGLPPESRMGRAGEHGKKWWDDNAKMGAWERIGRLNAIAKDRGQTLPQMALAWTLRLPSITSALIGASSVAQIKENIGTIDKLEFSPDEFSAIEDFLKDAKYRHW